MPCQTDFVKPFTPNEAKEIVLSLNRPAVFHNMVHDWPVSHWNITYLSELLQERELRFRIGKKKLDTEPQFETQCDYINGTFRQFHEWIQGNSQEEFGPFSQCDRTEFWAYADYKYLAALFNDRPEILQDISWADFGFPGRDGRESTLWVGSLGANTPCHIDSYGCNLVLQVEGRKKWHLFPPEDTAYLYPTRIPYEESSVFSKVNVVNPDRNRYPLFSAAHPYVITLHPGQVLLVPRLWWHHVESIDDITVSVNSWIELDSDHEARVEEAITRTVVCAFKSAESSVNTTCDWLNPTEDGATSHETNLQYLNRAVSAYTEHKRTGDELRRNTHGIEKPEMKTMKMDGHQESEKEQSTDSHFGQYLVPVLPLLTDFTKRETNDIRAELRPRAAEKEHKDGDVHTEDDSLGIQTSNSITSDEVLDCLVNPQVVRLVSQLLLNRKLCL
ncbi:HSPB1-associated protein 1 isoform X2 [Pseudophryne corroboree]|uniref:HSPB1-associated protein 1 isoform X2 n=1 Tax=Pseudophryne corroboree TaxID=495146 RepID=UPI003081EDA1